MHCVLSLLNFIFSRDIYLNFQYIILHLRIFSASNDITVTEIYQQENVSVLLIMQIIVYGTWCFCKPMGKTECENNCLLNYKNWFLICICGDQRLKRSAYTVSLPCLYIYCLDLSFPSSGRDKVMLPSRYVVKIGASALVLNKCLETRFVWEFLIVQT